MARDYDRWLLPLISLAGLAKMLWQVSLQLLQLLFKQLPRHHYPHCNLDLPMTLLPQGSTLSSHTLIVVNGRHQTILILKPTARHRIYCPRLIIYSMFEILPVAKATTGSDNSLTYIERAIFSSPVSSSSLTPRKLTSSSLPSDWLLAVFISQSNN